jgi:hypothetical protein
MTYLCSVPLARLAASGSTAVGERGMPVHNDIARRMRVGSVGRHLMSRLLVDLA